METTKICNTCNEEKELNKFSPHKKSKLGVNSKCKKCSSLEQKERYKANPNLYKKRAKKYRKNNPERYKEIAKKYTNGNPKRKLLDGCRYRAKKANIDCNIEMTDILIPEFCPILNIKIEFSKGEVKDNSPSVDRVVPKLGYVKGNIQIISHKANRIKGHATIQELKQIIKYIENGNRNKI